MKKKLLIFHPGLFPYRYDFFNALAFAFDTKVCLWFENVSDNKFDFSKIESQIVFQPIVMSRQGANNWIQRLEFCFKLLRQYKPDIVLCNEFNPLTWLAILFKMLFHPNMKVVSMIDDSYAMISNDNYFSLKHKLLERLTIPMLDNAIVVEPRVEEYFQKRNGIGLCMPIIQDESRIRELYKQALPISDDYFKKYGLERKKIVLCVGRLIGLKNVLTTLRAFNKWAPMDTILVVVGSGNEEQRLKAEAGENVIFTGRLEGLELYAWYNLANLFVLSSYFERFGAVTNEALLGGCYCLISNRCGSASLIEENTNGNVFDSHDTEGLARLMAQKTADVTPCCPPIELRPNMMRIHFRDKMEKVIHLLNE